MRVHLKKQLLLGTLSVIVVVNFSIEAVEPGRKYDFFCKDGQHFRGAVLIKETKKAYIIKLYYSDQKKSILKSEMIKPPQPIDKIKPTVTSEPKNGTTLNSLSTILLNYSEEVLFAGKIGSYILSKAAKNTLTISNIKKESATSYRLYLSGEPGSGELALSIDKVTDLAGNAVENNTIDFNIDTQSASVVFEPSSGSIIKDLKKIKLTFSKAMSGIDNKNNYLLTGSAVTETSIDKIEKINDKVVVLQLAGTLKNGSLQLSMKNISDSAGNVPQNASLSLQIDRAPPMAEVNPANGTSISAIQKIEIQYDKEVRNALDKNLYSVKEGSVENIKVASVENLGQNRYLIKIARKPRAGNLYLTVENVEDKLGNKLQRQKFQWQVEADGPSTRTLEKLSYWPGNVVYMGGYFSSVQGQMSSFFDSGSNLLLSVDSDYLLHKGPLKARANHPLLPSFHFELNYSSFSKNSRSLSGVLVLLGPIWYIPFYPSPKARFSFSFSGGYTFYNIQGLTFQGKVQTFMLAPELSYQYLFIKHIAVRAFIRENMILDPSSSLYTLALGLAVGYAF